MMTRPKCPICRADLKPSGKHWVCPNDNFFFQVTRGVPGRPMWGAPEPQVEGAPRQPVSAEDTFESWLAKHGVTKEMYNDANDRTKEELKVAFYQRGRKDADAVLLPPR